MTNEVNIITDETALDILNHLDGWTLDKICDEISENNNTNIDNSGLTNDEIIELYSSNVSEDQIKKIFNNSNKLMTKNEINFFYEEALSDSENHVGVRLNDFTGRSKKDFYKAVCRLAASKLWNKYNIRVEEDGTEGTYIRSYGGILYTDVYNKLNKLKPSKLYGLSS